MSNFPGSLDNDSTLYVAKDNIATKLISAMAIGDTVAVVASPTGWAANMIASVESEQMLVTAVAGNVLTVTRAFGGTSAAAHAQGKAFSNFVDAAYQSSLKAAVIAIETALGANLANVPGSPIISSHTYDFTAQTPGGSLSIGSNSIALSPMPVGLVVGGYLYISGGSGSAEAVPITGVGASNVIVTCANTHSGAWTIKSATAGIQEALSSTASPGGYVRVPAGSYTIYGPVVVPSQYTTWIEGAGRSATVLNVASTFPTSVSGVFIFSPSQVTATNADSGGVKGLTISFIQPDSTNVATYTHWPPAMYASGNNHVTLEDAIVSCAWDVFTSPLSNGVTIRNVGMSFFHRGITIDQCFDLLNISSVEAWPFGCTVNQTTAFTAVGTANYALDLQQVDFGWIDGFISISGKFAKLYKNGGGQVPVIVGTNIDMDTNGGFEMSNGYVSLTNVNVSLLSGTQAFSISGGTLMLDGVAIFNSGSTSPMFSYNPSQANAGAAAGLQPGLFIRDLHTSATTQDQFIIYATSSGAFSGTATVQVIGGAINRSPGVAYTAALFAEVAGTGNVVMDISGVKICSNGGTGAPAFSLASSLAHSVVGCDGPSGWTYAVPSTTRWFNNSGFTSNFNAVPAATKIAATSVSSLVGLKTENYIASETGANNAIVAALLDAGGVAVPLAAGVKVSILLAHTLQAGANTLNFNGAGVKNIKSSRNPANNIGTAYAVGGLFTAVYDGTQFLDVSQ
jgi:hypothetical protein